MYESFYGLSANPFRLVPDARFFYPSSGHRRGLAYLRYGIEQGQGFVVVSGQPGTGKSTLVQTLFTELSSRSLVVAHLTSTNLGPDDILQAVGHAFDVYGDGKSKASLLIAIENFLKLKTQEGKRVVLIVDEAHSLPQDTLEELRMLTNFQVGDRALLQVMLLGQKQLVETLAKPDMEQLSQRVIASCHLKPLKSEETRAYIAHRLRCVGWSGDPGISSEALAIIYAASHGVPRMINVFCDRLFLAAAVEEKHAIDLACARSVLKELTAEATGMFRSVDLSMDELLELPPLPGDDFELMAMPQGGGDTAGDQPPVDLESAEASAQETAQDDVANVSVSSLADNKAHEILPEIKLNEPDKYEPAFADEVSPADTQQVSSEQALPDDADINSETTTEIEMPVEAEAAVRTSVKTDELLQRYPELQNGQARSSKKILGMVFSSIGVLVLAGIYFAGDIKKIVQSSGYFDSEQLEQQASINTEAEKPPVMDSEHHQADQSAADAGMQAVIQSDKAISTETEKPEPEMESVLLDEQAPLVEQPAAAPVAVESVPLTAVINPDAPQPIMEPEPDIEKVAMAKTSDVELKLFLGNLLYYYKAGDLGSFVDLFAEDATADKATGLDRIRSDYQALFSATDKRVLKVRGMQWQHDVDKISGRGEFVVTVWPKNKKEPFSHSGFLNLEIVKHNEMLLIKKMSHVIAED